MPVFSLSFTTRLNIRFQTVLLKLLAVLLVIVATLLSGCASSPKVLSATPQAGVSFAGRIHGGQQPVASANILLYAAGSGGDGTAATPLLTSPAVSDSGGNFSITSKYTCPSGATQVYLVATGGNPGLAQGTSNGALSMMAALGPCGSLTPSTTVFIDEVTTVGTVAALYPYMSSYAAVASGTSDAAALTSAFTAVGQYVNTTTGTAPGPALPANTYASTTELNTLADIASTCINSAGGVAGDGTACGRLFQAAGPISGPAPTDVVGAVLDILQNPANNVAAIFSLAPGIGSPFLPALPTAPPDWTLPLLPIPTPPTFSPAGGTYSAPQSVTITDATAGATIFYTTDGSTPTTASAQYTGAISVASSQTLKAVASTNPRVASPAASAAYTITGTSSAVTATPVFSLAAGTYSNNQTVAITSSTPGAAIYFTTDNSTPTTTSTLYTAPIIVYGTETVKAVAISSTTTLSAVASAAYVLSNIYGLIYDAPIQHLYGPSDSAIASDGTIYVVNASLYDVVKYTSAGAYSTIGGGFGTALGDNGPAASAGLVNPESVAVDAAGNVYIADNGHYRIRKVDTAGIITTIVGNGTNTSTGDGGPAASATVADPCGVRVDNQNNLYILECNGSNRLRKVSGGIITTIAGTGTAGFSGDGGPAASAMIYASGGIAVDTHGNIYLSDLSTHRIRQISNAGIITTVVGNGTPGVSGDGNAAIHAQIETPSGLTFDAAGNLYFTDQGVDCNCVREVTSSGVIYTAAGNGFAGYFANGIPALASAFRQPASIFLDKAGDLYVVDYGNFNVREVIYSATQLQVAAPSFSVPAGVYTTTQYLSLATATKYGSVYYTTDGSTPTAASTLFTEPIPLSTSTTLRAIAIEKGYANSTVSSAAYTLSFPTPAASPVFSPAPGSYTSTQTVALTSSTPGSAVYYTNDGSTPTTSSTPYTGPLSVSSSQTIKAVAIASGYGVSVPASGGYLINQSGGTITTIAGNGNFGASLDGTVATASGLYYPNATAVDSSGNFYIADRNRVDRVVGGLISMFAGSTGGQAVGDNGPANAAYVNYSNSPVIDAAGNVYFAEAGSNRIRKVDPSGTISTFAGNGTAGHTGDGGLAINATLSSPKGLAFDAAGNLYIADSGNYVVRKVNTSGVISTVAGNGTQGFSGDGGGALHAQFNGLVGLAFDRVGNLLIVDQNNERIRMMSTAGVVTTVAGSDAYYYIGDGGPATSAGLMLPSGVCADSAGNFYIADTNNSIVRKVDASGTITTVAGVAYKLGFTGDGGPATAAYLYTPTGVTVDSYGNLYITDAGNRRIRKVSYANTLKP